MIDLWIGIIMFIVGLLVGIFSTINANRRG